MKLYPDQEKLLGEVFQAFNTHKKVCMVLPTGGGKTVLAATITKAVSKHGLVLFIVSRREIFNQAVNILEMPEYGLNVAKCASGLDHTIPTNTHVIVAMATTLYLRGRDYLPTPELVIIDEAHHARAKTWETILGWYDSNYQLGLTATPERLDGKGLGTMFDKLVSGPSLRYLIDNKRLAPYKVFGATVLYDREALSKQAGDFNAKEIALKTDHKVIGAVADTIIDNCCGKTTLVFSANIKASEELAESLNGIGIKAAHIDGKTKEKERFKLLNMWKEGEISVLSNVALFSEGVDAPSCNALVLAKPTSSLVNHLQQIGRVLRYAQGKEAVIYDLVGNCMSLGLPDSEQYWSLEGSKQSRDLQVSLNTLKKCPKCDCLNVPSASNCWHCQYAFNKPTNESAITEVTTDLLEIGELDIKRSYPKHKILKAAKQGVAKPILLQMILASGYKPGMLYYILKEVSEDSNLQVTM